jgi:amino acid adenylation domain-containing protein
MKTIEAFLSDLRRRDINLWLDGNDLCYKAPAKTLTPTLRQELKERKAEIITFLHNANTATQTNLPPILPAPRDKDLPLSFAQQRLWFLDQLESNSSAYNMLAAYRLTGQLNITALEQSLNQIIQRHEILRTTFPSVDGQPSQVIEPHKTLTLPIIDLQDHSEKEVIAQQLVKEEVQHPFNLAKGPLFRAKLLSLPQAEHILLITRHHIVYDGWSDNVLIEELTCLYAAFSTGKPSPLPQLPIQYADFAYWQREWLAGEICQKHLSYWKQQLQGAPPLLELPLDHPRPTIQTFTGAKHSQHLCQPLSQSLKTLSQNQGVTLFMTLLAAFKVLLYRYTGTEDIVVGSPVAGRNRSEVEPLIGFFINTVVLRTHLDGNPSFRELLGRVKEVTLGAYEHQDMPFEKLVEELQPERSLSHNPLFQVWFNMVNLKSKALELPELTVELLSSSEATSRFDITLYVREQNESITLQWVHNQDLFNPETIVGMAERFQTLLESIVANPKQPISNLSLLSPAKCKRQQNRKNLVTPDKPFTEFPKTAIEQSISARFSEQARKYPDNIAVSTKKYQWTYRSLNHQANAIANTLRQLCGENQQQIALLLEHDAPAIAAILGVLTVGNTYVILDPTHPKLRLTYILEDSQATVILTNNNNIALAKELTADKIHLINIDKIDLENAGDDVNLSVSPDTPAYILYTSGSTGQPKGVRQNHRNVLHFIRNYTNNLHIAPDDKLTLLASYSLDAAVMDIFAALLNGATLCPFDIKADGLEKLCQWLIQQEITIYHSTPTVYRHFIDTLPVPTQPEETHFPQIRLVVLGGEEVVRRDVKLYQNHFSPDCIFVNGLGPTESTVTLQYFINKQTKNIGSLVPVGYPVEETDILLLNQAGIDAQIYGEIAIRSPYVALEYWQKPERTQAAFIPDPDGGNRRIYRSGDLGRLRPDGTIEFLGRRDFQVKLRGFRIELREIEAVLSQHPQVKEAVVIATAYPPNNKRLIAYFVSHSTQSISSEFRSLLKTKLPNYMIPSAFVQLDTLPLTANGKIDRRALPAPEQIPSEPTHSFVAPRNDLELQLIQILEKVLGKKPISVNDNFFDLGGHSLIAVRLFDQIEKTFGKTLPLATLFQAATIEELANILRQSGCSVPQSSLIQLQPHGSKPPFFYVTPAGVTALDCSSLVRHLTPDRPFYALQESGLEGELIHHTSIEEIATRYIQQIRTVQPSSPYFIGGACFGNVVAFEMAQQLYKQGEKIALLVLIDGFWPDHVAERPQSKLIYLVRYVTRHLTILSLLPAQEKWNYIFRLIQRSVLKVSYKIYPSCLGNYSLIDRAFYYQDLGRQLRIKYVPQVYPGRVSLIKANTKHDWLSLAPDKDKDKFLSVWNKFATEGAELYDFIGHHSFMFKEPYVQDLAEKLQICLDKAQTETLTQNSNLSKKESTTRFATPQDKLEPQPTSGYSPPWQALIAIQPNGGKQPFFGVHTNDGSVLFYRHLVPHLNPNQPFYGLQAPLQDGKQIPFTQIEDMAAHYIKEIQTLQPSGPYLLGGFCIGGVIAFEMAQQLVAQGEQVALLALFDTFAPFPLSLRSRISLHFGYFLRLKPQEKLTYLLTRLGRRIKLLTKTTQKIPARLYRNIQRFYPSINSQKVNPYTPQVYPGRVTLFRASNQLPITYHLPDLGWGKLAREGVEVHDILGAHTDIVLKEPSVSILAEELQACIDKAQAELESNTSESHSLTTGSDYSY